MNDNFLFLTNQIKFKPNGETIDVIHKKWFRDYERLENQNAYIEWLFPTRFKDQNDESQALQYQELEVSYKFSKIVFK